MVATIILSLSLVAAPRLLSDTAKELVYALCISTRTLTGYTATMTTEGTLLGGETHLVNSYVCWKEVGEPFRLSLSYFSNMCFGGKYARMRTHQSVFPAAPGNRKE